MDASTTSDLASAKRGSIFIERYAAVFGRPQSLMLRMVGLTAAEHRAQGAWVTDTSGRRWLDFGSFGLHLLGHRHPVVVDSLITQLGRMGLPTKILANEPTVAAAEGLVELTGGDMDGVIFGNSGSEAVEAALKLARLATKRSAFVAFRYGYHGRTSGALAVSAGYAQRQLNLPAARVSFVDVGDLDAVAAALAAEDVAGAIIEPVQGEGGIRPVPLAFLHRLAELCRRHGTLLILDEIQSGLGRSGKLVSTPDADVIVFGKTLGGGVYPVSAAVYSTRTCRGPARDPVLHASSYAASPLGGAVACSVLELVSAPDFVPRIESLGRTAIETLGAALKGRPEIVDLRGSGLMIGIEFADPAFVGDAIIEAARRDLLVAFCLSAPAVLRVYPPAVISPADLRLGLAALCEAIDAALAIRRDLRPAM